MELNITLVVQAINFLCAYYILRYGFFSYAVAAAQADKEYTDSLLLSKNDLSKKSTGKLANINSRSMSLARDHTCNRPTTVT